MCAALVNFSMTGFEEGWPLNSTRALHLSRTNVRTFASAVVAELLLLRMTDCQPSFLAIDCKSWPWPVSQLSVCPPVPMQTLKELACAPLTVALAGVAFVVNRLPIETRPTVIGMASAA